MIACWMVLPTIFATLIAALPSQDGLVVCSDRRTLTITDNAGLKFSDSVRKLNPAGSRAVYSYTGASIIRRGDRVIFDVRRVVGRELAKLGVPNSPDEDSLFAQRLLGDDPRFDDLRQKWQAFFGTNPSAQRVIDFC